MQPGRRDQDGFTLMALLAVTTLIMLAVSTAGPMLSLDARRDRELELLRVGSAYARAIESYRDTLPGSIRSFPMTMDELLLDPRTSSIKRHLRSLYPDPLDPNRPWGVVRDEFGRIIGVYSQDDREPLRRETVVFDGRAFSAARTYRDWRFMMQASTP